VIIAPASEVEEHPERYERVQAGLADAHRLIAEDPETAFGALKDVFYPEMEQEIFDATWATLVGAFVPEARITPEMLAGSLALQTKTTGENYEAVEFELAIAPMARAQS